MQKPPTRRRDDYCCYWQYSGGNRPSGADAQAGRSVRSQGPSWLGESDPTGYGTTAYGACVGCASGEHPGDRHGTWVVAVLHRQGGEWCEAVHDRVGRSSCQGCGAELRGRWNARRGHQRRRAEDHPDVSATLRVRVSRRQQGRVSGANPAAHPVWTADAWMYDCGGQRHRSADRVPAVPGFHEAVSAHHPADRVRLARGQNLTTDGEAVSSPLFMKELLTGLKHMILSGLIWIMRKLQKRAD